MLRFTVNNVTKEVAQVSVLRAEQFEIVQERIVDLVSTHHLGHRKDQLPCFSAVLRCVFQLIFHVHNGCASDEEVDLVIEEAAVSELSEHLGCSLRVSDVGDLRLSGHFESVIDLGSRIILAELFETVIEEFRRVFHDTVLRVLTAVDVSTVVADPDVVALVGEDDGERLGAAENPRGRLTEKTVLQEDRLCTFLHIFPVNSEHS